MLQYYKVRLEPNNRQKSRFELFVKGTKFAYNWFLDREYEDYKKGEIFVRGCKIRSDFTQFKKTEDGEWLNGISSNATKRAMKDAERSLLDFFHKKHSFPRKKELYDLKNGSFYIDPSKIRFENGFVILAKIYEDQNDIRRRNFYNRIRLSERNRIPEGKKYSNPRVVLENGQWFITVGIEKEISSSFASEPGIGIDLGIKNFLTISDGVVYPNINKDKSIQKLQKRKAAKQRKVWWKYQLKNGLRRSGSSLKTKNIIKLEKEIGDIDHKILRIRLDRYHKIISDLIKRNPSFISMETLEFLYLIRKTPRNNKIYLYEGDFRHFEDMLSYACKKQGIPFILIDQFYPSSKKCSRCGNIKEKLFLRDRIYSCEKCGLICDRDLNAAINIMSEGKRLLNK